MALGDTPASSLTRIWHVPITELALLPAYVRDVSQCTNIHCDAERRIILPKTTPPVLAHSAHLYSFILWQSPHLNPPPVPAPALQNLVVVPTTHTLEPRSSRLVLQQATKAHLSHFPLSSFMSRDHSRLPFLAQVSKRLQCCPACPLPYARVVC